MTRPLAIDLFSGIGGFTLGIEAAGFETVQFCEISPKCRHLLNHHWPHVPCHDDVKTLTRETVGRRVALICGGFPCQDLSFAGKGAGLAGSRSGLWSEFARIIGEFRPDFVIVENVPALLVRGLGTVLGDLAALGYDAWWDCIPASAVGAPHRRDRLWIVAYARGQQHQGYGDALRREIAAELARAGLADADHARPQGRNGEVMRECAAEWVAGAGGASVADAESLRLRGGGHGRAPGSSGANEGEARKRQRVRIDVEPGGQDVADTSIEPKRKPTDETDAFSVGGNAREESGRRGRRIVKPILGRMVDGISNRLDGVHGWLQEPEIPRVAIGVPSRADRLHGLGNAVVPEIPEILARAILSARAA